MDKSDNLTDVMDNYKNKSYDEMVSDMNNIPFFMTELTEQADNTDAVEALKALAYDGTPEEIAENFRQQGNDCFKVKQYKDAVQFYTQALDQNSTSTINIACYGNRAQCNLELKNYRRCVNDCVKVLELDSNNLKAWYRSAKAFMQMDRLDESLTCCEHGLTVDSGNEGILTIKQQVLDRKEKLERAHQARLAREAEKQEKQRVFNLALGQRSFTRRYTEKIQEKRATAGDVEAVLADPKDPTSELSLPVILLYPISLESDIIKECSEETTINDLITHVFAQPPPWDAEYPGHTMGNLDIFAPTSTGGLAKVGPKSTLLKTLGTTQPDIAMVDGMCRLYAVPKQNSTEFLASWPTAKQTLYE